MIKNFKSTEIQKYIILMLLFAGFIQLASKPESKSESKYQISIKIEGKKDTTVYLANYFGSKILKIDSLRLDSKGEGTFTGNKPLKPGIYLVYMNDKNYFEFMIGSDQQFSVKANFEKSAKNQFTGADETLAFQQYQQFLASQREKQTVLQKQLTQHAQNPDSLKQIKEKLKALNAEMENYWQEQSEKYKGTFLGDFLRSMIIPPPPEFIVPDGSKNPDSLRWVYQYNFYRNHYWDNFNFSQPGLIRTPIIDNKLENYFKKTLLQIPDSVIGPTINVVEKSKVNEEMYQYILLYLLNEANKSEIMGMDKAFVVLSEKYVLGGKANWLDSATQVKIREKVLVTKPNLIGNIAPELKLPDSEGNFFSLRQMNGPFTILYFWEPDCSHCQKNTPQLYNELYLSLKDKGVDIFAVCTQNDKEKWMSAIQKYGIHEWTNVWDPQRTSNFRLFYDITSTPVIYILDKNKKIIAKRIDVETSAKFLKSIIERE